MTLTLVESKMLEALELALQYLTRKQVEKGEYLELIAAVRNAVKAGEYKEFGCPSGTHAHECTCTTEKQGISAHYLKYFKNRRPHSDK